LGSLPPGGAAIGAAPGAAGAAAFAVDWQVGDGSRQESVPPADPGAEPSAAAHEGLPAGPRTAEREGLELVVDRALGIVVVTARGTLDDAGSRAVEALLGNLIDVQGQLSVVVDLRGVTRADPGCLAVFVVAHGWTQLRGGQLVLAGVHDRLAAALDAAGVSRLVKVTAERIAASAGTGGVPRHRFAPVPRGLGSLN